MPSTIRLPHLARLVAAVLLLAFGLALPARAGDWNIQQDAAIGGADPVTYFTEQQAVPGNPAISLEWDGATWHFASEANRAAFAAAPARHFRAPQEKAGASTCRHLNGAPDSGAAHHRMRFRQ